MAAKLSIQIALHNREKYIKAAILSALDCGYEDTEIIVFDDASSDNSAAAVNELASEHSRKIRYIRSDENVGCANARASMVKATGAEYVLILDDDDILLPFDIAGNIKLLDEQPNIAGVYGKLLEVDENIKPLHSILGWPYSRMLLVYNNPVMHPGTIIRRSDILDAGNYERPGASVRTVAEDLFLWFRLSLKKDLHFDDKFRILYRQHSTQTTLRQHEYYDAANFIHRSIVDANKEIYDRILTGNITAAPHEVKTVLLLLAIISRYMPPDAPQRLKILNAAETISPYDYGVNAVKFEYFFAASDYAAAIEEALKILNNPLADTYIKSLGFEKILKVYQKTGDDSSEIEKQMNRLKAEYAAFPFDISKY